MNPVDVVPAEYREVAPIRFGPLPFRGLDLSPVGVGILAIADLALLGIAGAGIIFKPLPDALDLLQQSCFTIVLWGRLFHGFFC